MVLLSIQKVGINKFRNIIINVNLIDVLIIDNQKIIEFNKILYRIQKVFFL